MGRTHQIHHLHGCILAFFAILCLQSTVFATESAIMMRVGLTTIGKPHALTISCEKKFDVMGSGDNDAVASGENQQMTFTGGKDGIEITLGQESIGTFEGPLRVVSQDGDAVFEIISPKSKYKRYRGMLEIGGSAGLSVIDELPMEDYVRGVIPAEVPQSFHPEAQKALTVAIRTYALTSRGRHKSGGFDVCDTTDCQGFSGASRDANWIDQLVNDTRDQIATYNGKPIHAVYSSDCGGATASSEDAGFGSTPWPYLSAVGDNPRNQLPVISDQSSVGSGQGSDGLPAISGDDNPKSEIRNQQCDDYCAKSPQHTWTKMYTSDELARAFSIMRSAKIGTFQSMAFAEYDCSGRVKTVVVKGDKGEYRMTGAKFRDAFGQSVIKSTRIALTVTEDGKYVINGRGYGHGVGLCAYGANGLAKSKPGITYLDILKHYYAGIDIKPISEYK